MALVAADILTAIRDCLAEASASFFSDAMITRWIAQATREISSIAKCVETTTSLTITHTGVDYDLPNDCCEVLHVVWANGRRGMRKITPTLQGQRNPEDEDQPTGWFEWGGRLYVDPVPDNASEGETVIVYYAKITNDVTLLPESFEVQIIDFGIYRGKQRDRRFAEAAQYYNAYANGLAFKRVDIFQRTPHADSDVMVPQQLTVEG